MRYDDVLIRQAQVYVGLNRGVLPRFLAINASGVTPATGPVIDGLDPARTMRALAMMVRAAVPYYVSTDIAHTIATASITLPRETLLSHEQFPEGEAFCWFERPLSIPGHVVDPSDPSRMAAGVAWGSTKSNDFDQLVVVVFDQNCAPARLYFEDFGRPFAGLTRGSGILGEYPNGPDIAVTRFIWTLLGFVRQRIFTPISHSANRTAREQASRSHLERYEEVKVIVVRQRQGAEYREGEHYPVDWSHRWLVRGHWRNQACGPKREKRQTVWVTPYVKGPDDKPLVIKPAAVRAVVR